MFHNGRTKVKSRFHKAQQAWAKANRLAANDVGVDKLSSKPHDGNQCSDAEQSSKVASSKG